MSARTALCRGLVLSLAMLWSFQAWPAAVSDALAQGTESYRAGRYEEALQHFQQAWNSGDRSDRLRYNLGVTHYRLGDLANARSSFEPLTQRPGMAGRAHYNLGLVALKAGDRTAARDQFQQARATARSRKLRSLANEQLRRLDPRSTHARRAAAYAELAAGHDDNVARLDDTVLDPSERSSSLVSLLAGGEVDVLGDRRDGLRLSGFAYAVDYPQLSSFDLLSLRAGPELRAALRGVQFELGVYGGYVRLGGEQLQSVGTVSLGASGKAGSRQRLSATYAYESIAAGSAFPELDGSRQIVKLADTWSGERADLTLGYRYEANDREGSYSGPDFTGVSPTRHRGFAEIEWRWTSRLRSLLDLEYQSSRYDANRQCAGGTFVNGTCQGGTVVETGRRDDRRSTVRLGLAGDPWPDWTVSLDYRYRNNASNASLRDYRGNRVELGLARRFR